MAQTHYVCIHGHFYQPPRENPWLETIECQESAYPYPNWNDRILAECYQPNAASRIVDSAGRIISISNNYEGISFNFGPTLLSWLESHTPDVYQAILDADHRSRRRFSGHGSAIAQAYNHMIMPLANRRDKYTQVVWGIRDFRHRFGRAPEGMWLPETAVDSETLDIMAELGIRFTILAPGQARAIWSLRSENGRDGREENDCNVLDVSGGHIPPGQVYRATTPSGRHIDLFFYDGGISQAVAFEHLLRDGCGFAERLLSHLPPVEPSFVHIATDGETYGHHHRYGDMALAYALRYLEDSGAATLTNYSELLATYEPAFAVEIIENSAWSCAHGVGRWSDDCGCHTGANPNWHQRWRKPLRQALDWLRDELATVYEEQAAPLLADPWAARDDYISVILDRSRESVDAFLLRHGSKKFTPAEVTRVLQLCEIQRHAMNMYTSCGWFFDDVAGTEAVQILRYAARAIELAGRISNREIEPGFVTRLELAESNQPAAKNGRCIYTEQVLPSRVDLRRVIAHYAVSSLFDDKQGDTPGHGPGDRSRNGDAKGRRQVYCYDMEALDLRVRRAGKASLAVGTVRCTSLITLAESELSFGALHLGDHNLTGGVRDFSGTESYDRMVKDVLESFDRADVISTQRQLDRHFLELTFSLKSLFRDHQERILGRILEAPLAEAEAAYDQLYRHHTPLMRFLVSFDLPVPEAFRNAAKLVLQRRLRRALQGGTGGVDLDKVRACFHQAKRVGVEIEDTGMDYLWHQSLEQMVDAFSGDPDNLTLLEKLTAVTEYCAEHNIDVDLWDSQNKCYKLFQLMGETRRRQAYDGNPDAERWMALFERLFYALRIAT